MQRLKQMTQEVTIAGTSQEPDRGLEEGAEGVYYFPQAA